MGQGNSRAEEDDDDGHLHALGLGGDGARPAPPAAAPSLSSSSSAPRSMMAVIGSPPESFGYPVGTPVSPLTDQVRALIRMAEDTSSSSEEKAPGRTHAVRTVFQWTRGGEEVRLVGSFNQWESVGMQRSESRSTFSAVVNLPPGAHQYSFLVDGKLEHDAAMPTVEDASGTVHNVVSINLPARSNSFSIREADPDEDADDEFAESDDEFRGDVQLRYGTSSVPPDDIVKDPPSIPPHFTEILLNHPSDPASPYELPMPQHVTVNHLYMKSRRRTGGGVMVMGTTKRYQGKFVTTVYYKPVPEAGAAAPG